MYERALHADQEVDSTKIQLSRSFRPFAFIHKNTDIRHKIN